MYLPLLTDGQDKNICTGNPCLTTTCSATITTYDSSELMTCNNAELMTDLIVVEVPLYSCDCNPGPQQPTHNYDVVASHVHMITKCKLYRQLLTNKVNGEAGWRSPMLTM